MGLMSDDIPAALKKATVKELEAALAAKKKEKPTHIWKPQWKPRKGTFVEQPAAQPVAPPPAAFPMQIMPQPWAGGLPPLAHTAGQPHAAASMPSSVQPSGLTQPNTQQAQPNTLAPPSENKRRKKASQGAGQTRSRLKWKDMTALWSMPAQV